MSYHYHPETGVREIDSDTYAAWLAAGNPKALAYAPIADPPDQYAQFDGTAWVYAPGASPAERHETYLDSLQCTSIQGELALEQFSLYDTFQALLAQALPTMANTQKIFLKAPTWRYRDPTLQVFVGLVEMSDEQVIQMFEVAKTL